MKDDKIELTSIYSGDSIDRESFSITSKLRWARRSKSIKKKYSGLGIPVFEDKTDYIVLQQMHQGDKGTEKWEDVPTEIE